MKLAQFAKTKTDYETKRNSQAGCRYILNQFISKKAKNWFLKLTGKRFSTIYGKLINMFRYDNGIKSGDDIIIFAVEAFKKHFFFGKMHLKVHIFAMQ